MSDVPADNLPPFSLEAEMGVLGSIILDSQVLAEFVATLKAEHFYRTDHRTLYQVLIDMWQAGTPIDMVLLRNELKGRELLEPMGGIDFLIGLTESVPSTANAAYYARIVTDKYIRREVVVAAGEIDRAAYDGVPLADLVQKLEDKAESIRRRQREVTPGFYTASELVVKFQAMQEPIIDGVLRRGETMNLVGPSKMHKSWMVLGMCLDVATGDDWLTFPTKPGKVLLLDNELHHPTLANRLQKMADARNLNLADLHDRIIFRCLRGNLLDISAVGNLVRSFAPGTFNLIVLDALYRFYPPGHDENSNAHVTALYNAIDNYANYTNSAFALVHHASKGLQAGKAITDVGSGAGAQSRATDAHVAVRQHQTQDAVSVDAAVRSFKPISPFCLRWHWPTWELAPDLDPKQLYNGKDNGKPDLTVDDYYQAYLNQDYSSTPTGKTEIAEALQKTLRITRDLSRDLFDQMVEAGWLELSKGKGGLKFKRKP